MEREITILIKWIEAHDLEEGVLTAEKILGWAKYLELKQKENEKSN